MSRPSSLMLLSRSEASTALARCRISDHTPALLTQNLHFNKISRWFMGTSETEKHWFKGSQGSLSKDSYTCYSTKWCLLTQITGLINRICWCELVCQNFSKNYLKADYEVRKGKERIVEIGAWEAGLSWWSVEVAGVREEGAQTGRH